MSPPGVGCYLQVLKSRCDVWWATSDIGWIVGHSYMVYAPLLIGCTTIAFEGALDYPQADANWRSQQVICQLTDTCG